MRFKGVSPTVTSSEFAHVPEQESMTFKTAHLNVPGLDLTLDGNAHYTYKLPFAIQLKKQPCCTRLGWMCCPCCCPATGPDDAMDFVNQLTGDQVRFHRIGKRVHVFHNGQRYGSLRSTSRCCGSCREFIMSPMHSRQIGRAHV